MDDDDALMDGILIFMFYCMWEKREQMTTIRRTRSIKRNNQMNVGKGLI